MRLRGGRSPTDTGFRSFEDTVVSLAVGVGEVSSDLGRNPSPKAHTGRNA